MVYARYKAVTKEFNFSKVIPLDNIPFYGKDYVYDDEIVLAAYTVGRDIGMITTHKIIIFDNSTSFGSKKEITTVPYSTITAHSIMFHATATEIYLLLETGNPLLLKFVNLKGEDKYRLRLLYNAISASICGQNIPKRIIEELTGHLDFRKIQRV